MKVLFIGGTGNISSAVSRLAIERGIDLYLLNRGHSQDEVPGARHLTADVGRAGELANAVSGMSFDVVANFVAFTPSDVQRDMAVFHGRTAQYVFISSASVYQKPLAHPWITESTPLANPYWEYSRNKIACEEALTLAYREQGFPVTIIRPSLTYDTVLPVPFGGWREYTIVERMKRGQKIVVHGDGTSLFTVTHSEDFAIGMLGLLGHPQAIGQAFHITSDELLTWDQIHQSLAAAVGVTPRIVHVPSDLIAHVDPSRAAGLLGDKSASVIFDNTKLKRFVPGYCARTPFFEGIRRTVRRFEADPRRMQVNPASDAFLDEVLTVYGRAFPPAREA